MSRLRLQPRAIYVIFFCTTFAGVANALDEGWGFDRNACYNRTREWLAKGNSPNPEWFHRDPLTGLLHFGEENMELTLPGCKNFCGGWTWYWDAGPRVTTWIIPVLLLLSNIELSPIDKRRFMTIIHALGDPIDSMWSMTHKIYTWHRLYEIGLSKSPINSRTGRPDHHWARVIATVLAGFEEISGAKISDEGYYHMICHQLGRLGEDDEDAAKFREWHKTARELADTRTNEVLRTILAIVVYSFGLASAFSPDLGGGNTTPPGGRIGSAIFLSWLVPAALLSNTIGTFSSRRTCLDIISRFMAAVDPPPEAGNNGNDQAAIANADVNGTTGPRTDGNSNTIPFFPRSHTAPPNRTTRSTSISNAIALTRFRLNSTVRRGTYRETDPAHSRINPVAARSRIYHEDDPTLFDRDSWDHYFNSMQWTGSIYTYRPWKGKRLDHAHRSHPRLKTLLMLLFAFSPIFISALGASVILWYAVPNGFSCRHIWVLIVFGLWIFSVTYTWLLYFFIQGGYHWWAVLAKDAIIGISSLVMVILSTAGLFNRCFCWSVALSLGVSQASVPLVTDGSYEENGHKIYRFVVMACMLFHLVFFVAIIVGWRKGVELVRWSERQRRREWRVSMGERLKYTPQNFLIFWFVAEQAGV